MSLSAEVPEFLRMQHDPIPFSSESLKLCHGENLIKSMQFHTLAYHVLTLDDSVNDTRVCDIVNTSLNHRKTLSIMSQTVFRFCRNLARAVLLYFMDRNAP